MQNAVQKCLNYFTQTEEERTIENANEFGAAFTRVCRDRDYLHQKVLRLEAEKDEQAKTILKLDKIIKEKDKRFDALRRAHAYVEARLSTFLHIQHAVSTDMQEANRVVALEAHRPVPQARIDKMAVIGGPPNAKPVA